MPFLDSSYRQAENKEGLAMQPLNEALYHKLVTVFVHFVSAM